MGKGRRSQGPRHAPPTHTGAASATDQQRDLELGNAAQAEELDGAYIPPDAAGDGARPLVDNARMALEMRYEGRTPLPRLMELLQGSELPPDSAEWLVERLRSVQTAQDQVDRALERWFGEGGDDGRQRAERLLAGVARALQDGRPAADGWEHQAQRVSLGGATTLREAVDQLVAGLAEGEGSAVVGLCRELYLTVLFDDEDELPDGGLVDLL